MKAKIKTTDFWSSFFTDLLDKPVLKPVVKKAVVKSKAVQEKTVSCPVTRVTVPSCRVEKELLESDKQDQQTCRGVTIMSAFRTGFGALCRID